MALLIEWKSGGNRFMERCNGALEAEILACVEGIALALHWTMLPFEVETDWLTLTQMLQSREKDLSASAHLVREIRRLIDGDREISARKIHHAQNQYY
uniref:RNase H type-1 domain-containing protein n=1 Tax=Oryza rufipogon TaxID=4529 RepID=A0A0E0QQ71_ORYRU